MAMRTVCWLAALVALAASASARALEEIPKGRAKQIWDAAPEKPRVAPKKPRRVLIFVTPEHLYDKDPHKGYNVPYAAHAMKSLGAKSKAFEPVVSQDLTMFLPESLKEFDAIVLCNTSGQWIAPSDAAMAKLRKLGVIDEGEGDKKTIELAFRNSLTEWLKDGGGIMAFHFAVGANRDWPEFRNIIGATYYGHPWHEEVAVAVEEPDHPLVAAFGGKDFRLTEEIFQFNVPYSRDKLRVLLSLDTMATNMGVKWIERKDHDFALAWVKSYGKGRVFYTAFGHRLEMFQTPATMQFYLDGIQFAMGDIEAPTAPRPDRPKKWGPGPTPPDVRAAKMKEKNVRGPSEAELKKILEAAPDAPPAKPAKPRRVLVWGHSWTHGPNPFAEEALKILGQKSGAFKAVVSDDPRLLIGDRLPRFDALVLNNIHEPEPFLPDDFAQRTPVQQEAARKFDQGVKKGILEFVRNGKGLIGIHAATAALQGWKEYGDLIGARYAGHIFDDVAVKLDAPDHPINACFQGKPFTIHDEIYIFGSAYSRKKLGVLLSLDTEKMKDPGKREDKDYAVSWIREAGKGRVFYTTLGHAETTYWNPLFLRHLLAGIQYATGDLSEDN